MMNFKKTKLAAAVGTAAMAMALSAPANAVVLGGDNGWEVSMTGTINLFYNHIDFSTTCGSGSTCGADSSSSHLNEGLLPAFFTFKAKSPTVNGLTGTAQISFAPDSSSAKSTRQDKGGNAIDMREVFFSVDGGFGTVIAGRTLGLFGRQAILKDQTLFGVGGVLGPDGGGTTLGRIGFGYIYPEFRTHITYKTPVFNGFQIELGVFDPQEPMNASTTSYETSKPQFQGEATYNTNFQGGSLSLWIDGIWQEMEEQCHNSPCQGSIGTITSSGFDVGGEVSFSGITVTGNYYDGQALGMGLFAATQSSSFMKGGAGVAYGGFTCVTTFSTGCHEANNNGYYVQAAYTFNGKTKIAASYGESNQEGENYPGFGRFRDISNDMWVVGVYHDLTPWLKLVAEYAETNSQSFNVDFNGDNTTKANNISSDVVSLGGFIFW
jgi:hypothetical protein